jgi:hypothetical protein
MAKRRTDITMAKRRTDNTMAKRRTDNTMAKSLKNRQYNGQEFEEQTIQWPRV